MVDRILTTVIMWMTFRVVSMAIIGNDVHSCEGDKCKGAMGIPKAAQFDDISVPSFDCLP